MNVLDLFRGESGMSRRIRYVALAVLVCVVIASGAMAQWFEDFESYPDGTLPDSPWGPAALLD